MSESYAKQLSKKQILELRSILSDLPPYVKDFMRSIETTTQPRTRIGYAHDIKYFFEFLQSENPFLKKKEMYEITYDDINKLEARDIEEYLDYLNEHPHIAVFEDGVLRYEIVRENVGDGDPFTVHVTTKSGVKNTVTSLDNMGYAVTVFEY